MEVLIDKSDLEHGYNSPTSYPSVEELEDAMECDPDEFEDGQEFVVLAPVGKAVVKATRTLEVTYNKGKK